MGNPRTPTFRVGNGVVSDERRLRVDLAICQTKCLRSRVAADEFSPCSIRTTLNNANNLPGKVPPRPTLPDQRLGCRYS